MNPDAPEWYPHRYIPEPVPTIADVLVEDDESVFVDEEEILERNFSADAYEDDDADEYDDIDPEFYDGAKIVEELKALSS